MQLANMRLEAYNGDKNVISRKIDTDLLDLLTKQFKTNKAYSGEALKAWKKLIKLSGLSVNKRFKKYRPQAPEIQYYKSPDELCRRLEDLIVSKKTGNESVALDNKIVKLLDRLLVDCIISKKEYAKIHDNDI